MDRTWEQKMIEATREVESAVRGIRELERLLEDAKDRFAYAVDKYETLLEEKE